MIDGSRIGHPHDEIGADGFAVAVDLVWGEGETILDGQSDQPAARLEPDLHFLKRGAWNPGFVGFGARAGAAKERPRRDARPRSIRVSSSASSAR